ncbi:type I DNA topoisomerase [Paratissierella segnis]|uniref:DNA topoisomerase 1 n=1 Tax=Paratissierella segnis TaxID=2763679 RepID=A0A926EWC3_9FIRM|nr:type I DNA topoisomerase [Paratissierella segnis]MBC8588801.1 type I DNA topoisomerase [Paratissierella segnis]
MAKNLVIVESPAKAKTIGKILGKSYKVIASVGHIRDLPKSTLGIDIEDNFKPKYINIRGKGPLINELKKEGKNADKILLATDPDREGEAISWHLAYILDIDPNDKVRVEFNEITSNAIKNAIKKPRALDINLIDAQQARRILDRLVGYKISPLLWKKIKKGLSAGRVQSVAVKFICDREEEIDNFIPQEYWTIKALLSKDRESFEANFIGKYINNKEKKVELKTEEEVNKILSEIENNNFIVHGIKRGQRKRKPYPPFTTSTLQQDASKKLGFTTKKTMMVAQQLYEGIDLGKEGTIGLITYMRTDSTRIAKEAINSTKDFIYKNFGKEYSNGGKDYTNKSKKETQDAHEGIRPTNVLRIPDEIKGFLSKDQFKLYKLIWDRFVGSQMKEAIYDTLSVNILNNDNLFKASGSKLAFLGFLKVYITTDEEIADMKIPDLNEGDILKLKDILPKQNFTQPPARFTEASLIKTMEEKGIGRPSTYAPTIATILARNYVALENKIFYPTDLGKLVNDLLTEYFNIVVNEEFTADLEKKLDNIAEGNLTWVEVVDDFYSDFKVELEKAEDEIDKIEVKDEVSDVLCEKCGRNMVIKSGRYGKFLACPGFPECRNTKPILDEINVNCPECDDGKIVRKKTKNGRTFYGCSNYPNCEFVSWDEPYDEKCPNCGEYMVIKRNKSGDTIRCSNKECGYIKK